MAGQKELIIKLIILTVVLVALGVGGYFGYKYYQEECPDGLFVCMGIDDADADADADAGGAGPGGAGPGGSDGRTTTPLGDRSPDFVECTRYFDEEDKTKTCYDAVSGKGGLRWFWSNTDGGKKCSEKTKFYKIEASTAANDHGLAYTYIQPGGKTNGLIFNNAKHITQKDGVSMNMKFNITPLDKDKKNLSDPLMGQELDPGGSVTTDCTSIGTTPLDFTKVFNVKAAEDEAPPPPPPVDCAGSWAGSWGACETTDPDPICGVTFGKKSQSFTSTTQSSNGGKACPSDPRTQTCLVTENCKTITAEEIKQKPMCEYTGFQRSDTNQFSCNTACTSDPGVRDGGKIKYERSVKNVNYANGSLDCNPDPSVITTKFEPCAARPMCPVDCVGNFDPSPEKILKLGCAHGSFGTKHDKYVTEKTYKVTTPTAHSGRKCVHHNGEVIKDYRYVANGRWGPGGARAKCSDYV